ncbi:MAG: 5-formyltetrahydrofolate cyclo-ligase, partial [Clostridia bacterium]|nr:5-formyltetrahydrofolate cyclo-ligase [Clostridia bacterium]
LISRLIAEGKSVYLPRVEGQNIVPVKFSGKKEELKMSALGISEPTGQAYGGPIDVCITPLLAVNSRGYRLGYGGGYYDRYFADGKKILKVGIGYSLQYTDELQEEENDVPLDIFVSERGIITFGR